MQGPRRRILLAALAALVVVFACGRIGTDFGVWVVRGIGQRLAGNGTLSWQNPEGVWSDIGVEDASRRAWSRRDAFLQVAWSEAAAGLALGDLYVRRAPDPRTVDIALIRVDPTKWTFSVVGHKDWSRRAVAAFAAEERFAVTVNASYFSKEGPLGLVVSGGESRNRQVAHRAAHFLVRDGTPHIVNQRKADVSGASEAFQGFPAIMSGGRTYAYMRVGGRGFDVWQVERRTAACVDRDGNVILLVTDTVLGGLSLDELATILGGLGCADAMGFDGGSSTGLAIRVGDVTRVVPNPEPVPVVLGVLAR